MTTKPYPAVCPTLRFERTRRSGLPCGIAAQARESSTRSSRKRNFRRSTRASPVVKLSGVQCAETLSASDDRRDTSRRQRTRDAVRFAPDRTQTQTQRQDRSKMFQPHSLHPTPREHGFNDLMSFGAVVPAQPRQSPTASMPELP